MYIFFLFCLWGQGGEEEEGEDHHSMQLQRLSKSRRFGDSHGRQGGQTQKRTNIADTRLNRLRGRYSEKGKN